MTDDGITYGGGWQQTHGSSVDMMSTLSLGFSSGSTLSYDFEGNFVPPLSYLSLRPDPLAGEGITVYGSVTSNNETIEASFSLDDRDAEMWSAGPITGMSQWNYRMYSITDLDAGNHTLIVNVLNVNLFYFDYILVKAVNTTTTSSGSPDAVPKKSHIGPVIAGVLGGISALIIGAMLLWWWRRRKRRYNWRVQPFRKSGYFGN